MEPNLQAVHIHKIFPGVKALTDVSIDFYPGKSMHFWARMVPENPR